MRIMGLDVGEKTIGVAISDPFGWTAQGINTIHRKGVQKDLLELDQLVKEYAVEEIVVGLPLNMNGSEGESAVRVRRFVTKLKETYAQGMKITLKDERLSTVAAQKILLEGDVSRSNRKKVIDKMAAVYILQGYLDYIKK